MRKLVPLFGLVIACGGGAAPSGGGATAPRAGGAAASIETLFPLEDGRIYHYVTNENGETGMLVAKVHRTDATHGELRLSNSTKRFVFSEAGVAYERGPFLLKNPIDVGSFWPGEHGGSTRVTRIDATPKVLAGSYAGCVETVEEGARIIGARYTTTYCPGVGMVLLEVQAPGGDARAELKSYGFPVKIE